MYIKHNFLIALLRFSFEWNNPTGYLFASAIQYMIVTFVFYFVACSSTIAIAVYLFTMDATNDIIENLQSINEAAKSEENLSNAMIQIAEFIQYHSILKQLSQHVLRHIDTTVHSWCSFRILFPQINECYFESISAKECDIAIVQCCAFGMYNANNSNSKWPKYWRNIICMQIFIIFKLFRAVAFLSSDQWSVLSLISSQFSVSSRTKQFFVATIDVWGWLCTHCGFFGVRAVSTSH